MKEETVIFTSYPSLAVAVHQFIIPSELQVRQNKVGSITQMHTLTLKVCCAKSGLNETWLGHQAHERASQTLQTYISSSVGNVTSLHKKSP